jgi:hypothetical protein
VHHHQLGPSDPGAVILELGGRTGALVVRTGPAELLREIEISPVEQPGVRSHAAVRERRVPGAVYYAAVYPDLPAGRYTVWADGGTPAGTVDVRGGGISDYLYDTDRRPRQARQRD